MSVLPTVIVYNGHDYKNYVEKYNDMMKIMSPYSKLYINFNEYEFLNNVNDDIKRNVLIILDNYEFKHTDINKLINKVITLDNDKHCNFIILTKQKLSKTLIRNPKIKVIF